MLNKILYGISMVEVLVLIVLGGFVFENVQLFLYELLMREAYPEGVRRVPCA